VHVGHADVGEDDIGIHLLHALEARLSAVGDLRGEAFVAQQNTERIENSGLVVDDEDTGFGGRKLRHALLLAWWVPTPVKWLVATWRASPVSTSCPEAVQR